MFEQAILEKKHQLFEKVQSVEKYIVWKSIFGKYIFGKNMFDNKQFLNTLIFIVF